MFYQQVFGNISGGFCGISRFCGNFAGLRPREISEALSLRTDDLMTSVKTVGVKRKQEFDITSRVT